MNYFTPYLSQIVALCKQYKVKKLFAFGSALTERFNDRSDVDLLVEFGDVDKMNYAGNYFDFKDSLEDIFKREVDLVENKGISNPFFRKNVDKTKQLIYG